MKIISGGQTGADQGALLAAREMSIETGGWAPKGWRTETGPAPWLADYGLKESSSVDYHVRTRSNILSAQATVIFGKESRGSRLTWDYANSIPGYKVLWVAMPEMTEERVEAHCAALLKWAEGMDVLNVASNRESVNPGIQEKVKKLMLNLLAHYIS